MRVLILVVYSLFITLHSSASLVRAILRFPYDENYEPLILFSTTFLTQKFFVIAGYITL
jgi:hypothetical protein